MMRLSEIARFTPDPHATIRFYEKFLGMKPIRESHGVAEFLLGDVKLFIHESGAQPPPGWPASEDHIAFEVENVDATCRELTRKGLAIQHPPRDYPWGRSAYLRDPDGRRVEVHEASKATGRQ